MESDQSVVMTVAVPPRFLGNEKKYIKNKLDACKNCYLQEVDGYLMKWEDLKVLDDKGKIMDDQPFIFWTISFTGRIFKIKEGKMLKGKVEKITKTYLIVKVIESFSLTVTIPEEFKDNPVVGNILLESEIYFKIKNRYRGFFDEECIELSENIMNKELDDVYAYADKFEY